MSTKIKSFSDRVFAGAQNQVLQIALAVFATLDSSYPSLQRHIHSCGHICHMYKDQEGLQAWRKQYQELLIFFVKPYDSVFISKPSSSGACIHSCCNLNMLSCIGCCAGNFLKVHFEGIAIKSSKTQVIK